MNLQNDPSQPIEPFLKKVLTSLDLQFKSPTTSFPSVDVYAPNLGKHLKPNSAIVFNGKPVVPEKDGSKLEFQKKWLQTPISSHQLNNYDCHLIPGSGLFVINSTGKVRFDESGRNKLGQSPDLITPGNDIMKKPVWGSWFGFCLNIVVDESVISNDEAEVINNFNYRITYKPPDSVVVL